MQARPTLPALFVCAALVRAVSAAPRDEIPRWTPASGVPLPASARSLKIERAGEAIYAEPSKQAPRRGAAQQLARLPIYAHRSGDGCGKHWYLVGPSAWVCGDHATPDRLPPVPATIEPRAFEDGLALKYHFVKPGGTSGYSTLQLLEEGIDDSELAAGFAVGVLNQARNRWGDPVALTTHGLWLRMEDLRPANPSRFAGTDLTPTDAENVGWVHAPETPVFSQPGRRRTGEKLRKLTRIAVRGREEHAGRSWVQIGEGRWIRGSDARLRTPGKPPATLHTNERWIDVDIANQIVTAYEGVRPVFATLTSTGKGAKGTEQETPKGEHRIWVKLARSDMDNLEDAEASRYYAMQAVPWVMFFRGGYGLHGVYWHESFGSVRSQGCVNLAPRDAQRLFHWSHPKLPAGWSAVLPTRHDPGTLVVVR